MRHRPRLPRENVNVSHQHPLREGFLLASGVIAVSVGVALLGALTIELIAPHIPVRSEVRLFGLLGSLLGPGSGDAESRPATPAGELLERLSTHWPDSPYTFRIWHIESAVPNALAAPGGWVGITSGLLERIENENELAFVLAHELGHFYHRHHLRSLGRGLMLNVVFGVVGHGLAVGPILASRSFDREQEREADRFGLELVQAEYGHLAGAWDFFEKLPGAASELGSKMLRYTSTHPVSADRIEALRELARERDWPTEGALEPFPG